MERERIGHEMRRGRAPEGHVTCGYSSGSNGSL